MVKYSASMQYMLILAAIVCILFGAYLLTKGIFKTTPKHEATWNPRWCYRAILAGVTERNDDGTSRQELVRNCRIGEPLMLIADPLNKFGRNAIMVCRSNGQQLGFIAADFAETVERSSEFYAEIEAIETAPFPRVIVRLAKLEDFYSAQQVQAS